MMPITFYCSVQNVLWSKQNLIDDGTHIISAELVCGLTRFIRMCRLSPSHSYSFAEKSVVDDAADRGALRV